MIRAGSSDALIRFRRATFGRCVEFAFALAIAALVCAPSFAATDRGAKASSQRKKATPPAKASSKTEDPREAQARQAAERELLIERIARLKKEIAAGEKSRAGTAAALARAERALSDANQRLAQLALRQQGVQQRIADLDSARSGKQSEIATWRGHLARTATEIAANADEDPFKLYLTGRDPNSAMLDDAYLGYLARAEIARVDALRGHVSRLDEQRQNADAEKRALAEEADAATSARESLMTDQGTQRKNLARLTQTLAEQRKSASALEADQQRLSRVVEQLQREIDRRAAAERARREAARRKAEETAKAAKAQAPAARKKNGSRLSSESSGISRAPDEAPPPTRIDAVPDASVVTGDFAQQRGRLRLPVRGVLTARFGTPRGEGGASWKGLFIKTDAAAEVHAVAAGRVVFADYLRGFGNLLIVDHGDQYLSIYGNNETLKKHAGDAVKAGDVISLAGDSSGDDRTGLYFELRFRGKPFDPLGWVGGR